MDRKLADRRAVRQIPVPPQARALSTLARIDYADSFVVATGQPDGRTPEQWARTILDRAPIALRGALVSAWIALALRLRRGHSDGFILGWELLRSGADHALLGARSRIGMPAELLVQRWHSGVLFATFVRHQNALARAVWAATEPGHAPVVRYVLERAAARA
jgi:hypothetical protein